MARGGKRQGRPGGNYANRTDMRATQPIQAAGNGEYGSVTSQENAQRAIPLENQAGVRSQQQPVQRAPGVMPGELGALDRPTDKPGEPVTAGAPFGAGPGMEALGVGGIDDEAVARLQVIYQQYPSEGIRQLLETLAEEV